MLRSQTSTVQIRVMQDAIAKGWGPPLKIVAPGRVYRPDTVDATHSFMLCFPSMKRVFKNMRK